SDIVLLAAVVLAVVALVLAHRRQRPAHRDGESAAVETQAPEELAEQEVVDAWVQFLKDHVTQAANGLNNRLSAIAGVAQSARDSNLTESQQSDLERIQEEIRSATEITGSLLNRVTSEAPETAPPAWNVLRDAPVRSGRILVVEDDDSNRNVMSRLFRKLGHTVTSVANGYEAHDTLEREKFDCIICDLRMPTLGGKTLYEQIENKDPEAASRFVFVTGDYTRPESYEFLQRSGRPVIGKPYEVDELLAAVATVLGEVGVIVQRGEAGESPA
ncbi:MAG: response regulator, partial [Gemmatimonadales bacterium]